MVSLDSALKILYNDTRKTPERVISGLQLSMINRADGLRGMQSGGFNYAAEEACGLQSGMFNYAGDVRGVQLGGVNVVEAARGLQLGLTNVSLDSLLGFQVGITCYAGKGNYVQVGLVTVRTTGPWYTRLTPGVGFHIDKKS